MSEAVQVFVNLDVAMIHKHSDQLCGQNTESQSTPDPLNGWPWSLVSVQRCAHVGGSVLCDTWDLGKESESNYPQFYNLAVCPKLSWKAWEY